MDDLSDVIWVPKKEEGGEEEPCGHVCQQRTHNSLSRLQILPVIQYASIHTAADPPASGGRLCSSALSSVGPRTQPRNSSKIPLSNENRKIFSITKAMYAHDNMSENYSKTKGEKERKQP